MELTTAVQTRHSLKFRSYGSFYYALIRSKLTSKGVYNTKAPYRRSVIYLVPVIKNDTWDKRLTS
jgi:hypothetical protein